MRIDLAKVLGVVPALLIVGGTVVDIFTPARFTGLPLLACAPLLAGILLSFRAAVLCALVAAAVAPLLSVFIGKPAPIVLTDVLDVVLIGILGLWITWYATRQNRHLAEAQNIAEAAQRAVLPAPPTRAGPFTVAARYVPAQVGARIGGDFYVLQDTPFGIRAIIGDVRGKGLSAVSAVSVAVGAFREAADHEPTLPELADRLDRALDREGARRQQPDAAESFTTALFVEIPPDGGALTLLNRGHTAPYLVDRGRVTCLEPSVPELPLSMGLPGAVGDAALDTVAFPAGATLLLVTDGVTEARDARGVFYDPAVCLAGAAADRPDTLADALVDEVGQWTDGQRQDDMAVLILTSTADGGPPPRRLRRVDRAPARRVFHR